MPVEVLSPLSSLLKEQYVLIQAWKKTVSYIRYHNWYADTLELDYATVNLPEFLDDLSEKLRKPEKWENDPLRVVPAPKSQKWKLADGEWKPDEEGPKLNRIRPLAHVSLKDQVAATAIMLCLADKVETRQGNPCTPISTLVERRKVISYGNRLFCNCNTEGNGEGVQLKHRWGSTKLYRSYFQDYKTFLSRPDIVAEKISPKQGENVIIIHSDLQQFYDRVSPELLYTKISQLFNGPRDKPFFALLKRVLNWQWHVRDSDIIETYKGGAKLDNFSNIALPQGLVAGGFFANIVLLDFDTALKKKIGKEIIDGVKLHDACRYVDDIRLVITTNKKTNIEEDIKNWLQGILRENASGLKISDDKTVAAFFKGDKNPLVMQSPKMERIQRSISGGFDPAGGLEILDAIQGLIRTQARFSRNRLVDNDWDLSPIPDVKDGTVARFAAGRFRKTFRSLRPLLENFDSSMANNSGKSKKTSQNIFSSEEDAEIPISKRKLYTQGDLDNEAKTFALGLVEEWFIDPSNVRLLLIGLDLWPSDELLNNILNYIRPNLCFNDGSTTQSYVACYCLAEIFRAGATETGFVPDNELLPDELEIKKYRDVLLEEGVNLLSKEIPWYLKQQVLLFFAANKLCIPLIPNAPEHLETKNYINLMLFLRGYSNYVTDYDFATLAVLARRSYLDEERAIELVADKLTKKRMGMIAAKDHEFALEILDNSPEYKTNLSRRIRHDLCLEKEPSSKKMQSLAQHIKSGSDALRNEYSLLEFSYLFLKEVQESGLFGVITPCDILISDPLPKGSLINNCKMKLINRKVSDKDSIYAPPEWCTDDERWRFQLGYTLRFILAQKEDFTKPVREKSWREGKELYRPPGSHYFHRLHGMYSGHSAFGADWLPISEWTEQFLYALLRWPGSEESVFSGVISKGFYKTKTHINKQLKKLKELRGKQSDLLMIPTIAPWPYRGAGSRGLRICIAQTVVPEKRHFSKNPLLNTQVIRREHRSHLATMLSTIEKTLELRDTHRNGSNHIDLLVLPELAVNPSDIQTHLVPFVRANRTIIVAGLTYEALKRDEPMVNSALWVIPTWSKQHGLRIITRRQGKWNLSPVEQELVRNDKRIELKKFRPCQWIINYEWTSSAKKSKPLRLTASICYDATDIQLASDLRDRSDVFIVPALNQDVNTFDQMALALHYHMYQMVVIANNGSFGGSNAYAPYMENFKRQIFHLHGQPQASIAFLEIEDIEEFLHRGVDQLNGQAQKNTNNHQELNWKYPPAGYRNGGSN